jgi:hypothetical protein
MEFASRKACIEHYQEQYPNLPRYMIDMALNYDLHNGATTTEKPLTGKQKRKQRRRKALKKRDTSFQDFVQESIKTGNPLEIDCAKVIKGEYKLPPFVKGHVVTQQPEEDLIQDYEEITTEGELDDALLHRDQEQNAEE